MTARERTTCDRSEQISGLAQSILPHPPRHIPQLPIPPRTDPCIRRPVQRVARCQGRRVAMLVGRPCAGLCAPGVNLQTGLRHTFAAKVRCDSCSGTAGKRR